MTNTDTETNQLNQLRDALLDERKATKLENLAAALLGRLLGVTIAVAKSGFQHGADAGPAGRQGRRLRVECKKYSDRTSLSDRELLGEIDHALSRDPALEAWVLVATRDVSEQLEQSLNQKGESLGLPVVVLDWKTEGFPSLAALCAFAPDLVESFFSTEAGVLARELQPAATEAVELIRRDLQAWSLGFEALRSKSHEKLDRIWRSPRAANAALGQNAAGGAENRKVRRRTVHDALDAWWNGPSENDAPVAVVGWDGVGKTWATLDWLVERREELPIILAIPSSAAAELKTASETAVKRFLADRFYELTCVRDRDHWLRRLDNLLKRPVNEGPVLTILFDGLNQEQTVPWLLLLKALHGETFSSRIRVIITTRTHHYDTKLGALRSLIVPAVTVRVEPYDTSTGGELDQMLAFEELTRGDLHPELVELARTPRLFRLVVELRERLVDAGQVTIHGLLWEYGRDSFGIRAGKSFSEDDWRAWLQEIAHRHREGVRQFSLRALGESVARPDLSEGEVYARLSDIIDGQFTTQSPAGNLQLKPEIVAHALGAALLAQLGSVVSSTFDSINAELTQWLDPIAGLDQRAEILRASVSILVECGRSSAPIAGVLVTAWLQTQNVTDNHRRELVGLAVDLCDALLDAIEHSAARTHSSARLWAINALRSIPRSSTSSLELIAKRARQWLAVVSRDVRPPQHTSTDLEESRSKHFKTRIGVDASIPLQVLCLKLQLVDWDDGALTATIPSILEGFPLAGAASVFETAALSMAVGLGSQDYWDGLKWLCLLNEVDPVETALALRTLSSSVHKRTPEIGVNSKLPARVAALLLWLTGEEIDETVANKIDPGLDRHYIYEKDYLPRPGRSFFPLERRHAEIALNDAELSLDFRIQRTHDFWLEPTFVPSPEFVKEIQDFVAKIEVEKLNRQGFYTAEDHNFEELEPVLARCAPELLSDLIRRKIQEFCNCPPESRYWEAIHATDHFLLIDETARVAARTLRLSSHETIENNEAYAASQLLILELHGQAAFAQANAIVEAGLKFISVSIGEIIRPVTSHDADLLINRFEAGSSMQRRDLLIFLSHHSVVFSNTGYSWLLGVAFGKDEDLHKYAFRALAKSDALRFGQELLTRNWTWSAGVDHWVNHYGTDALVEGTMALPFDQIAPRVAPWRLLEAARRRGSDPTEICLAAAILDRVVAADQIITPDLGSNLSVDCREGESGPFIVSITLTESGKEPKDLKATLQVQMDVEGRLAAHKRAAETAVIRIHEAREKGAGLYFTNVDAKDLEAVFLYAPDLVEKWLEGSSELTSDFNRRVMLAEATYVALCEVLLKHKPVQGVALWRSLHQVLITRFIGAARIDELIHLAFRVPDTPEVEELRAEILGLGQCHTDLDLFNLAIAATYNGKTNWLSKIIEEDKSSSLAWRRKRGITLEGFTCYSNLPVEGVWPDGEIRTGYRALQYKSAHFRYREACAHYWWRFYLTTGDVNQAHAAWILFLRSADRRAWVWMAEETQKANDSTDFFQLKISHAQINRSKLKRAMEKNEEKLDKNFLDRKIVDGIGPWKKEFH